MESACDSNHYVNINFFESAQKAASSWIKEVTKSRRL